MTARAVVGANFTLASEPGENIAEVERTYIKELQGKGHDLGSTEYENSLEYRCRGCGRRARMYTTWLPIGSALTVFSDFFPEDQCEVKQMNVIGGEE